MTSKLIIYLFIAVWVSAIAAFFFYAPLRRMSFRAAFLHCLAWTAVAVAFMQFNYLLADALQLSRKAGGYVRGKQTISSYEFVVQLLVFLELGIVYVLVKRFGKKNRTPPSTAQEVKAIASAPTVTAKPSVAPPVAVAPVPSKGKPSLPPSPRFTINGSNVFLVCCAAGNGWLGIRFVQHSLYGLVFLVLAGGLLIAAYRCSFTR